jgi:hypothetical protein
MNRKPFSIAISLVAVLAITATAYANDREREPKPHAVASYARAPEVSSARAPMPSPSATVPGLLARMDAMFEFNKLNVTLLGASGAISANSIEALPTIATDDAWTFRREDRFTQRSEQFTLNVVSADRDAIAYRIGQNAYNAGPRWELITPDRAPMEDFLRFPLTQGKSWSHQFEADGGGAPWKFDDTYTVLGEERVTVPAGTFDAVVIQRIRYEQPKLSPPGFEILSRWKVVTTQWYAPNAKHIVRETRSARSGNPQQRSEEETVLVSYRVK